jgi:hypothetical protein
MKSRIWSSIASFALLGMATAHAATRVETFVIAVGGLSSCFTFIPPAPVAIFFGGSGVYIPSDGISECGIEGGMNLTNDPFGPLNDSTSLDTVFGQDSYSGSAAASARYGLVAAEAHGSFAGPQSSLVVDGADGYGLFQEAFSFSSPSIPAGDTGSVRLRFTIAGILFSDLPGHRRGLQFSDRFLDHEAFSSHGPIQSRCGGQCERPNLCDRRVCRRRAAEHSRNV